MAIDLKTEELIPLTRAAELIPGRNGERLTADAVWRWCRKGHQAGDRTIRLEHYRQPRGDYMTSIEAVQRFLEKVTALDESPPERPLADDARQKRFAAELEAEGVL